VFSNVLECLINALKCYKYAILVFFADSKNPSSKFASPLCAQSCTQLILHHLCQRNNFLKVCIAMPPKKESSDPALNFLSNQFDALRALSTPGALALWLASCLIV
jgi:hypothetical protein